MAKKTKKPAAKKQPATPEQRVADALRYTAAKLMKAYEDGTLSQAISLNTVHETLLMIAEELDS